MCLTSFTQIGLHVNSSRWQLDEEASQRRSSVFWQLFHQDTWIVRARCIAPFSSLLTASYAELRIWAAADHVPGFCRLRPTERSRRDRRCCRPSQLGLSVHSSIALATAITHIVSLVHAWSWQYSKLLHTVMNQAFGAKTPHYSTVLDLDRQIRDFPIPWRMRIKCGYPEEVVPTNSVKLQRWFGMASKESSAS